MLHGIDQVSPGTCHQSFADVQRGGHLSSKAGKMFQFQSSRFSPLPLKKLIIKVKLCCETKLQTKPNHNPPTKAVKKIKHKAAPAQIETECAGPRSPSLTFHGAVELPRTLCFPNLIMLYYFYTTFVVQTRKQR